MRSRLLRRGNIIFPAIRYSRRFPAKEVLIAVSHGQAHLATRKQSLRERGVLTANAAGERVTFLYDPALDDGGAFLPRTADGLLRLAPVPGRPGYYRDAASGSVWDYRTAAYCRRRPFAGLLGVLPGLFTGFVCCASTLALLLGAQIAAALIGSV